MKPGAYQEFLRNEDRPNFEAVIIGEDCKPMKNSVGYNVTALAWRDNGGAWINGPGFFDDVNLRPHPDADRVWAEWCAYQLSK